MEDLAVAGTKRGELCRGTAAFLPRGLSRPEGSEGLKSVNAEKWDAGRGMGGPPGCRWLSCRLAAALTDGPAGTGTCLSHRSLA